MMTKKIGIIFFILISLVVFNTNAQIVDPVKWSFSTKKVSDCEAELIFRANINDTWHLYGQKSYGDEGPVPTSFLFTKGLDYELVGKASESNLIKKFEPVFGFELNFFEHEAIFKQLVKIKSATDIVIKGSMEFMLCNEIQCLAPTTKEFSFTLKGSENCLVAVLTKTITTNSNSANKIDSNAIYQILKSRSSTGISEIKSPGNTVSKTTEKLDVTSIDGTKENVKKIMPEANKMMGVNKTISARNSWWGIFILGFLAGLAALLTPCVFPMIPMTVSFFTKKSKTHSKGFSNAIVYALSIIVIYVLLGLGVTIIFGSDALNALSTNVWFNLAFFLLLVVFAISFLGAFEIVLPSSFVNKMDSQSDRGGLIGIFFMAFTLSLVSFSCTGPIIGTLLVDAAVNGGIKGPFWGMFGFSTALALPFGLFAAFPSWLHSLPKSGGWLNSVKVVLGFLELALALKFASNADLVVQAGYITREIFIALWIVIFGVLGIYLMGWIKFSHDSEVKHISVTRLFFAILTFSFTVYLVPGLWGAPLKLISGFPPPDFYSESPNGFGGNAKNNFSTNQNENKNEEGHKKEHCPNELPCFHNYDEALAFAKKVNKPLMLDFTGWACVNCRKMESQVWTDAEVDKRLRNDVILVSLYVDDKTELATNEQTIKKLGDRDFTIKTIGNRWSYMQADRYKTNTQPQYVLIDTKEHQLTMETAHYDPDIKKYIDWLDEGITAFNKR